VIDKLLAMHFGERLGDADVAMVTIYYQYYLSRAIDKVGGNYLVTLKPWRTMLALGLTTTPEYEDPTRSDTHAWSAHPIYDLLTIVAGIHPAAPGFTAVRIEPHPGTLDHFDASMPHPHGIIRVGFEHGAKLDRITVDLPMSLNGILKWHGQSYPLHGGDRELTVPESAISSPEKER
jgi:alpha-L-rhamnosidase